MPFTVTVNFDPSSPGATVALTSTNCTLDPAPGTKTGSGSVAFLVTVVSAPGNACTFVATTTPEGFYATANQSIAISRAWTGDLGTPCHIPSGTNTAGVLGAGMTHNPPYAYVGPPDWGLLRADKDAKPANATCTDVVSMNSSSTRMPRLNKGGLHNHGQPVQSCSGRGVRPALKPIETTSVSSFLGLPLRFCGGGVAPRPTNSGNWLYVPGLPCVDADLEQLDGSPLPIIRICPR